LSEDELKLYRLIWTRFLASQMNPAVYDQTTVEISAKDYCRASGRLMKFDGFLKVYEESSDEDAKPLEPDDEQDIMLPPLKQGEKLKSGTGARQHFTEPPPRYTEASLVKDAEEKGIDARQPTRRFSAPFKIASTSRRIKVSSGRRAWHGR